MAPREGIGQGAGTVDTIPSRRPLRAELEHQRFLLDDLQRHRGVGVALQHHLLLLEHQQDLRRLLQHELHGGFVIEDERAHD